MTSIDVKTPEGKSEGKVDLPAELFDVPANVALIHQVVVAQLAAARGGNHDTKDRGEVSGSGKKPFKQKGTGRARQGSIRAPQYRGGGVVHGPTPRDYSQRTPKKMKVAALRGALSDRARNGQIHVVSTIVASEAPSTKAALAALANISTAKNILVVLDRSEVVTAVSLRNAQNIHVLVVDQLNTYDVLVSDDVVFTKAALETFIAGPARGKSVTAVATSAEVEA
jgi:large subunit ribosomal protein L4